MTGLEEARAQILQMVGTVGRETVALKEAAGRIAADSITSNYDLPLFDNSAMDGYAVRSVDVSRATMVKPAKLKIIAKIAAGEIWGKRIEEETAVRVFTGSAMPIGADAVVMQEDTIEGGPDEIQVLEPVKPYENVRLKGEDVRKGDAVAREGAQITPAFVGLIAALGVSEISVFRRLKVGLLATGSELQEAGRPPGEGKVFESNRAMLASFIQRIGAEPTIYPIVRDEMADTKAAFEKAFNENQVVVTSGGVSVGEFDYVKQAFEAIGGKQNLWKVNIKPGKPFVFGRKADKFLFGLPGNPVSALVTFVLLVRPALLRMQGAINVDLPCHTGVLLEQLSNRGDRRHFMRVCVENSGKVRLSGTQASHMLSSLATANGLVDVAPGKTLEAGTTVQVWRLDL
ncbi:MAG TPA: gephyrin-like molybdotransferase Glp [Verrucomicrobiae bacterium]|nr:gephyrin-like molybdotransferase Glp [Verrucomicrobiae bacterium]